MVKFRKNHQWGHNTYKMYVCTYIHKKLMSPSFNLCNHNITPVQSVWAEVFCSNT